MAVRTNGSGDYIRRTTSLPAGDAITVAVWCRLAQIRSSTYQYWGLEDAASSSSTYTLTGFSNGGVMEITENDSNGQFASQPTANNWFFWAFTMGSGSNSFKGYWGGLATTTLITVTANDNPMTPAALTLGNDSYDEWMDAAWAHVKVWDAILSAAELEQERWTIRPQRLANLHLWSPLWSTSDLNDYSGNGRNWTGGGTLASEDGPPVSWGARPWIVQYVATGGGTTYNQSAAGTLTPAGATVHSTHKMVAGALTTAGALAKRATKSLAGTLTTAGAAIKQTAKSLAGTLTSSGALATARVYLASLSGTLTTAGTLTRSTRKSLAGTLTTAGALARSTSKSLAGTLTTAGTLAKRAAKVLAGTLTTAGALVADFITGGPTYTQAVGGTLTTAGALARSTSKSLAGTLAPVGAAAKRTAKSLAGTLTSAGALLREWFSPSAAKLDVTLTDALTYTCTLTDARVYTCTLADALTYTVTLGDSTT